MNVITRRRIVSRIAETLCGAAVILAIRRAHGTRTAVCGRGIPGLRITSICK